MDRGATIVPSRACQPAGSSSRCSIRLPPPGFAGLAECPPSASTARRGARRSGVALASEVLAHEIGHTGQARRLGIAYWPAGAVLTLWREGPHWWNRFENDASEQGQLGGLVNGSVYPALMEQLRSS